MNNPNDRTIRAIVATGSLVVILAIGMPWVDEYIRMGRDASELGELQVELVNAQQREQQLNELEEKLDRQLVEMLDRGTNEQQSTEVREKLIGIIRAAGARLRNLDVGKTEARVWALEGDDPRSASMPTFADESDFELLTHTVDLRVDSSLESVRKIMGDIINQGWLMTTNSMRVAPTGVRETPISIELRLTLYGLRKRPEEKFDEDLASLSFGAELR